MILCFLLALMSCSEEETLNNDVDVAQEELAIDLSEYQDTSYGMYKGVFSTNDSQERGVVEIQIVNETTATAKIELVSGTILTYTGTPNRSLDGNLTVQFDGNGSSFEFVVAEDGSNPLINRAVLNDKPSFISAIKENTRGALITNPGLYSGTNTSGVAVSGTWNIVFDSQADADGNTMAFTSQIIVSGLDIGSAMGNVQENCSDDGTFQMCDVSGTGDMMASIVATWSGVHTSIIAEDCSQFEGTWTATGAGGGGSGTFISDQQCAPPANDECSGAETLVCGDVITASTAAATTTGEPTEFCVTGDPNGSGIWYTYVGTAIGNEVTVDLSGSNYDTKLWVYTGDCGVLTCVTGDDDGGALLTSLATFTEEEGVTYYFYAAGFNGASGTLALSVTCTPPPPPAPTCQGTATSYDGTIGAIDDNACPTNNEFIATSTSMGTIGVDADIDNLSLDITHTWSGDLNITLISPAGTTLDLSSGNGGSIDNYVGTEFRDGGEDITAGSAPFTGVFQPEGGTFAATFDGESVNGDWILAVCDAASGDTGGLDAWSISFCDETIEDSFGPSSNDDAVRMVNDQIEGLSKEEFKKLKGIE